MRAIYLKRMRSLLLHLNHFSVSNMESPQHKKLLSQPIQPQYQSPEVASLATLGMRIRKAVSEGYKVDSPNSYNSQYIGTRLPPQQQQQDPQSFQRVPLPSNISQPPALTNAGSTFQSGLNVSEWGAPSMNFTTIPLQLSGNKRKFLEDEPEVPALLFEGYSARHGQLQFDEDF